MGDTGHVGFLSPRSPGEGRAIRRKAGAEYEERNRWMSEAWTFSVELCKFCDPKLQKQETSESFRL